LFIQVAYDEAHGRECIVEPGYKRKKGIDQDPTIPFEGMSSLRLSPNQPTNQSSKRKTSYKSPPLRVSTTIQ
jgi:hypothetical protein